jgi:hypothetical protein
MTTDDPALRQVSKVILIGGIILIAVLLTLTFIVA